MFKPYKTISKFEIKTEYSSVSIESIEFDPCKLEDALPDIVLNDDSIKHMFAEKDLNPFKRKNIYNRFIPQTDTKHNLESYIQNSIHSNKSFYSFLAEGILGLVYRDLYGYDLDKCVIDICDTLSDSHTGVDACMYDSINQYLVLGEAKFYESFDEGLNAIINDFTKNNIKNKLESMKIKAENNIEANNIIIKNLNTEGYLNLNLEAFMNQTIIFAGFVLHSESNIKKYESESTYNKYKANVTKLKENICNSLNLKNIRGNYSIIFIHLPINQKKNLIYKIIKTAEAKLKKLGVGHE